MEWASGREISILNREARFPDHPRGAARSEDTDVVLDKALGQVQQSRLVIDRDNGDSLRCGSGHGDLLCTASVCLFFLLLLFVVVSLRLAMKWGMGKGRRERFSNMSGWWGPRKKRR